MTGIFLSLSRVLPDRYPLDDDLSRYVDAENGLGHLLDVGIIVPRLTQLYDWSADELGLPELSALLVRPGATPPYAWDPQDAEVWHPQALAAGSGSTARCGPVPTVVETRAARSRRAQPVSTARGSGSWSWPLVFLVFWAHHGVMSKTAAEDGRCRHDVSACSRQHVVRTYATETDLSGIPGSASIARCPRAKRSKPSWGAARPHSGEGAVAAATTAHCSPLLLEDPEGASTGPVTTCADGRASTAQTAADARYLTEWEKVLDSGLQRREHDDHTTVEANELRQNSPFAGVLPTKRGARTEVVQPPLEARAHLPGSPDAARIGRRSHICCGPLAGSSSTRMSSSWVLRPSWEPLTRTISLLRHPLDGGRLGILDHPDRAKADDVEAVIRVVRFPSRPRCVR